MSADIMLLASSSSVAETAKTSSSSTWLVVVGALLLFAAVGLVYFGIKMRHGYKLELMPESTLGIPKEDTYVPIKAKVLQKVKTVMPALSGEGQVTFIELKIGYTVEDEKYTQIVTDNGYQKGDIIDIKYNPDNPQEFYLDDELSKVSVPKTEENENTEVKKEPEQEISPFANISIVLGFVIGIFGLVMIVDRIIGG